MSTTTTNVSVSNTGNVSITTTTTTTQQSFGPHHVSFGQVTVVVVERMNTPPPELLKVPNPYVRQALPPMFAHLFTAPPSVDDAIAMMIRFTKELANKSPDLFLPVPSDDDW